MWFLKTRQQKLKSLEAKIREIEDRIAFDKKMLSGYPEGSVPHKNVSRNIAADEKILAKLAAQAAKLREKI